VGETRQSIRIYDACDLKIARRDSINNPKLRKRTRSLTDEQVAAMRAARKAGATYRQLGIDFGMSQVAAYNVCKGVNYAETHQAPDLELRAVRRLRETGYYRRARTKQLLAPIPTEGRES
jgi:hypothetical protein